MNRAAPGGALREGRFRPRALLSAPDRAPRAPTPLVPRARRRRWRIRWLVLGGLVVLALVAWAVLASPLGRGRTHAGHGSAGAAVRVPAVAVRVADGVRVFDEVGDDLGTVATPPAGVPVVVVEPAAVSPPTVLAALRVRRELPPPLAAQVAQIGATSPDGVWLRLRDGTRVQWGSPEDAAAKAHAVDALRRTVPKGRRATIDVSAATAPAVSW
jgi:hypothetical protein